MAYPKIIINDQELITRIGKDSPLEASEMDNNFAYIAEGINLVSSSLAIASVNTSGTSGTGGTSGTAGTSGQDGTQGISGTDGSGGTSGTDGTGGSSGTDGTGGSSGTSGITGGGGSSGSSGTSGINGFAGTNGTAGSGGTSGTSATFTGTNGVDGTSGSGGTSGTSGIGATGSDGTSGTDGSSGTGGTSGTSGLTLPPGTSGTSGVDGGGGGGTGIFTTGSAGYDFFETTSSLKITGSLAVQGSITASAYAITGGGGDPILTSAGNIILSASIASSIQMKGAPLRLPSFVDSQTSSLAPSKGDLYFNTTTDTFYVYNGSAWTTVGSGGGGGVSSYTALTDIPIGIISSSAQIARLGADIISSSAQVSAAILPSTIANSQLVNSSLTINGTAYSLGSSVTSSVVLQGTDVLSGSVVYNNFKSAFDNYTASINTYTQSLDFSVDSSSFATTGSNVFTGNQNVLTNLYVGNTTIISGSLVVSQSITVGVDTTTSQRITGSVEITGSLNNIGSFVQDGNLTVNNGSVSANGGLTVTQTLLANDDVTVEGNLNLTSLNTGEGIISASAIHLTGNTISDTSEYVLTINGGVNILGAATTSSFVITTGSVAPVGGPTLPPYAGYVTLPHVLHSLDFADDTEASASGVPIGGIYRNGNFLMIRVV